MRNIFFEKVYKMTKKIPKGKVATYGQLARLSGSPKAGRAVGMAMKKNPDLSSIPCHRVVASNGSLRGYSAGKVISTKRKILMKEGFIFQNDKVDLKKSKWIP